MSYRDPEKNRAYAAAWRKANPEKILAQQAAYRKANREKAAARSAAWRAANREKHRTNAAARYAANREKILAQHAAWEKANREKHRAYEAAWRKANPDKTRAKRARRRAKKLSAPLNDFTAAQWKVMQAAYDFRCVYCQKRYKGKLTQDHLTPLSKGGSHTACNIVPSCRFCNGKKQAGPVPVPVQPILFL